MTLHAPSSAKISSEALIRDNCEILLGVNSRFIKLLTEYDEEEKQWTGRVVNTIGNQNRNRNIQSIALFSEKGINLQDVLNKLHKQSAIKMRAYNSPNQKPDASALIRVYDDQDDDEESTATISDDSATEDVEMPEILATARGRRWGSNGSKSKGETIPTPVRLGDMCQRAEDLSWMPKRHVGQGHSHTTARPWPAPSDYSRLSPQYETSVQPRPLHSHPASMPTIRNQPQIQGPAQPHIQLQPQAQPPQPIPAPVPAPAPCNAPSVSRVPRFNPTRLPTELDTASATPQGAKTAVITVDWVDHFKFTIVDNLPLWRHCIVDAALQATNTRSANPPEPRLVGLLKRVRVGQVCLEIKGLVDDLNAVVRSVSATSNVQDVALPTFEVQVKSGPSCQRE